MNFKNLSAKFTEGDPEAMLKYPVYADPRSRGYIIKTGLKFGVHFRVYERGNRSRELDELWQAVCKDLKPYTKKLPVVKELTTKLQKHYSAIP